MADTRADLEPLVKAEAIKEYFGNMQTAIFSSAAASAYVALAFSQVTPTVVWLGWLSAMYVHLGLRMWLVYAYQRRRPADAELPRWGWMGAAGAACAGMLWGVAPIVLVPPGNFEYLFFIALVVGTLSATAALSSATYLPALFGFYLPAMLPLPLIMFQEPHGLRLVTGLMFLIYLPTFIGFAFNMRRRLLQWIRLRLDKAILAEELTQHTAAVEAAMQEKSRFLAAASHDLRQPMHALTLFVESLKADRPTPTQARLIENIDQSVAAMDGLFHALLDVSRLDAGVVKPEPAPFPVQELFDRLALAFAGPAAAKQLRLRIKPTAAWACADRMLCERILHNLAANAIQYSDRGGVLIAARKRQERLVIQIWDTGPGIPPDARETIFKEFVQLGNPERDRRKGLGLGLAIVRRLSDLLDARLALTSREGRGSCFSFSLPLVPAGERNAGSADDVTDVSLSGATIAVVDDESHICEAMATLLDSWGARAIVAGSGSDLLQILNRDSIRPDVLVCDYRLRDNVSGVDVIMTMREEFNAHIPALLVTGDTAPDRLLEAAHSGLPLLHKPVSPKELRRMLATLRRTAQGTAA